MTAIIVSDGGHGKITSVAIDARQGDSLRRSSTCSPTRNSVFCSKKIVTAPGTMRSSNRHSADMIGGCQSVSSPERACASCSTESHAM